MGGERGGIADTPSTVGEDKNSKNKCSVDHSSFHKKNLFFFFFCFFVLPSDVLVERDMMDMDSCSPPKREKFCKNAKKKRVEKV